ncbi:hypothetical protein D9613_002703 [Agrocybe pediades]|uniref:Vacuolar import and degradation protein-domain-containing protein n=1 Tax=Agrocybe pediades TaxID=84607 RepID=A0A8H4QR45_9AGAR|nr:hypothetical protein D9613_002703 [Agrocybe pediades]KAF9564393.1 hypothetical protein CPC08DRAFT_705342 [Agrocybe pediades]
MKVARNKSGRKAKWGTCRDLLKTVGDSESCSLTSSSNTMPSEHYHPPTDKLCSSCHSAILDPISLSCPLCPDRLTPSQATRIDQDPPCHENSISRRPQDTLAPTPTASLDLLDSALTYHPPQTAPSSPYPKKPVLANLQCLPVAAPVPPTPQRHQLPFPSPHPVDVAPSRPSPGTVSTGSQSYPHPLTDVTRLRMRSRAHHCLYPGATFLGTQKSGRNSYDVNVTIVDVNFAASTLCGYLRIRGLTDDWPELTTYFDAEIIGNRYGFLTQSWGASQHEDLVHWSRFPAFKHIRHEAQKPHMTLEDRDRGVIFMRWKERFLVPDHRVQDINGASFAGFYYVCVDFNPPPVPASPLDSTSEEDALQMPLTPEFDELPPPQPRRKSVGRSRTRRDSSTRRVPSLTPINPPVATMSGFYYHQNSEPYQQLSLLHVPEPTSSSFEFR